MGDCVLQCTIKMGKWGEKVKLPLTGLSPCSNLTSWDIGKLRKKSYKKFKKIDPSKNIYVAIHTESSSSSSSSLSSPSPSSSPLSLAEILFFVEYPGGSGGPITLSSSLLSVSPISLPSPAPISELSSTLFFTKMYQYAINFISINIYIYIYICIYKVR